MTPIPRDEASWVRTIRDLWGPSGADVDLGDDACVLPRGRYALSTDTLLEHVDFECGWAPPAALGYKALAANLSDLAAMGATPRFLLLTLGWPPEFPAAFITGLLVGMRALASREGMGLCGGDLTRSPQGLLVSLTVAGEQECEPLRRSGGRPGDLLYVGGGLGGPAAALQRFRAGERLPAFDAGAPPREPERLLLDRFYRPPSQTALGRFLAEGSLASCCLDVSDGLSRDLARLCEASGCGAVVEETALLLAAPEGGHADEGLRFAVLGGEEQVLLFASPPCNEARLREAPVQLHPIGRLTEGSELRLLCHDGGLQDLPRAGFDHFLA